MRTLDTIARLQLDDRDASMRRHLAARTTMRSLARARSAPAPIDLQPDGCQSTAASRTAAAQRPA
ncbi:MAG: hypothetical protein QOH61_2620 [Chloroflexota bacterium]|jgi:hypothetical protein|nr:hypothetical protein [Chloroflexota bacterium]